MNNRYQINGDVTIIFIDFKEATLEVLIDTKDLQKLLDLGYT